MTRGHLRVYLGAAPGVGKTYRMLDEGWRRRERGTDVVIGYVETHDRAATAAQLRDLEVVPRVVREYRGTTFEEMDLAAVLARRPDVVLVDELAHSNAPGSEHDKRWRDVETILDAGVDVITTVNIQHLESVNDVVERVTGVAQRETVPDAVVRRAEQVELVDVTPEALRRRMAHGNIYKADKIDASLSNYFRLGNLSALRELALLWLADRVEDAMQRYQDENDISTTWETRERLVVGVAGDPTDEVLLRRAARIASRVGAELIAVHVVSADGFASERVDTAAAQELVAEFEGTYQELVDDNVALALVALTRSERGTQIVLGAGRPRSWRRPGSGVVENVLRRARDLDVHVIALNGEHGARERRRPRPGRSWARRIVTALAGALTLALVTPLLCATRADLSLSTDFLVYLVLVLSLAALGGSLVGVLAALAGFTLENYYFVTPLHTLAVARPNDVVSLVALLVFAVGASVLVNRFAQRSADAERARGEARILAKVIDTAGGHHDNLRPLLDAVRRVFSADRVAVLSREGDAWHTDVVSGDADARGAASRFEVDGDRVLEFVGADLDGADRRLVEALARRVGLILRGDGGARDARRVRGDLEVAALRRKLWRHVDEQLQRLRADLEERAATGVVPARQDVRRVEQLEEMVADLDRLNVDVESLVTTSTSVHDVLARALGHFPSSDREFDVRVDLDTDRRRVAVDPEFVERAMVVVLRLASDRRPRGSLVRVCAGVTPRAVEILVVDQGDVTPVADDLPLRVAEALLTLLGGHSRREDTPGGGRTIVVSLPLADSSEGVGGPKRTIGV